MCQTGNNNFNLVSGDNMDTVIKNGLISIGLILIVMTADAVRAQGFTPKNDVVRARLDNTGYVMLHIKNYNDYKQRYTMTRNGKTLKGELRLQSGQSKKIRIKLIDKGYNKVCMVSVPTKNQNRVIAFCDTILLK
jgi:hypothetical protein